MTVKSTGRGIRQLLMVLGTGILTVVGGVQESRAQSCAYVGGFWQDTTNSVWSLTQAADNSISGRYAAAAQGGCPPQGQSPPSYDINGSYQGGGNFNLTATELGGTLTGCASTIYVSGNVSGGGCDTAGINWTNNAKGIGVGHWHHTCIIPAQETTVFEGWDLPDSEPTVGHFRVTVGIVGGINYGGRTVAETFPDSTTFTDTCWFPNSAFRRFVPTAAISHKLDASENNTIGDNIGIAGPDPGTPDLILYYRQNLKAPCAFGAVQKMTMSCDSTSQVYATNQLTISIGDKTVNVSRAGVSSGDLVWGMSQTDFRAAQIMNAILGPLLISR